MNVGSPAARERFLEELEGYRNSWVTFDRLEEKKKKAADLFASMGYPSTKSEDWRYTDIALKHRSVAFQRGKTSADFARVDAFLKGRPELADASFLLVFWEGKGVPEKSRLEGVSPREVSFFRDNPPLREAYAQYCEQGLRAQDGSFSSLNLALFEDGYHLHLGRGRRLEAPLHVLFLCAAENPPSAFFLRNLVILEEEAGAEIVHHFYSLSSGKMFGSMVTEIYLKRSCELGIAQVDSEQEENEFYHREVIRQEAHSTFWSARRSQGIGWGRRETQISLEGEGASCDFRALAAGRRRRHADFQVHVIHRGCKTKSFQHFRGLVSGESRNIFNGRVDVEKKAAGADARQSVYHLLLSPKAEAFFKPQLEIECDDVQCSHGAGCGPLEEDLLFYLRSRGLSTAEASRLVAQSFAEAVWKGFPWPKGVSMTAFGFEEWLAGEWEGTSK